MLRERLPTPEPSVNAGADGLWCQLSCTGSGAAKVASRARIRPNCSASVRRPPRLFNSGAPARGRRKSRRGRGYALVLRERLPTPEPPGIAGVWSLGSTQLRRLGGGESRVAGEDTPSCSASVRRPPTLRSTPGQRSLGSTQLRRLGGGESRVAGEDTPQWLHERSPTPEPRRQTWSGPRLVFQVVGLSLQLLPLQTVSPEPLRARHVGPPAGGGGPRPGQRSRPMRPAA